MIMTPMIDFAEVAEFLRALYGDSIVWTAAAIIVLTVLLMLVFWFRDATNRR